MNVASKDLCFELHEISGWADSPLAYSRDQVFVREPLRYEAALIGFVPAYDLAYLLRKLPFGIVVYKGKKEWTVSSGNYWVDGGTGRRRLSHMATPEDAAAKLAIELFKQGVLAKEAV